MEERHEREVTCRCGNDMGISGRLESDMAAVDCITEILGG